jgi:GNAT superfamily N-acetyltransferase
MISADLTLSKRLELAEATSCVRFAEARRRLFPKSGACFTERAGASAVFDGINSPCTQTFGLGLFALPTPDDLDNIEHFFTERQAPTLHEISPFAGIATLDLLCQRNYRPEELSSVLYRPVEQSTPATSNNVSARIIQPDETDLWNDLSVRGWAYGHPELLDFLKEAGTISSAREQCVCFLAEVDGIPGAAGALCLHQGVALFAGAATLPQMRRRGLQTALLNARMKYAFENSCDLAMMVALPGSDSQRNAERQGFRIAYTRTKWRLGAQNTH